MKAIPNVSSSSITPIIQVSSRGYLNAPNRNTCAMCTSTSATMKFEPQPCSARRNQPSGIAVSSWTSVVQALFAAGV